MSARATAGTSPALDPGLARLVDGLLLPGFDGTRLPDWLAERLRGGLAGVFLFGQNVQDPDQLRALTAAVHEASRTALVASDEEGGDVTRIEHAAGSSWPGAAALGRYDDVGVTERLARAAGAQAAALGVDLLAAPVADVHADPANPVIGIRSFGSDPALVSRHVAASVRGCQAAGPAACAKHWPGHGSTRTDSHLDLPVVADKEAVVRGRDLPPFAAAVAAGVECVMTAHVRYPAFDDEPATVSRVWTDLLRHELGFAGVLVCDALDMRAVSGTVGRGEGGVRALLAGVDLLCTGNPAFPSRYDDRIGLDEVRDAVVAALDSGRLPRRRVEEAVARVADLGAGVAHRRGAGAADPGAEHASRQVVRAVTEVHGPVRLPSTPHVVDLRAGVSVAAGHRSGWLAAALRRLEPGTTEGTAPVAGERPVVAVVDAPHRHPAEAEALTALAASRPDAVVVQTGSSDGAPLPVPRWLRTWGDGRVHAEVAADLLLGRGETP